MAKRSATFIVNMSGNSRARRKSASWIASRGAYGAIPNTAKVAEIVKARGGFCADAAGTISPPSAGVLGAQVSKQILGARPSLAYAGSPMLMHLAR
jgi:hypothetical protein